MTAIQFWEKVKQGSENECWSWLGYRTPRGGYGSVTIRGRSWNAHKIAWEFYHKRRFPVGMDACHTCDNPPCCNPHHVWPGTRKQNLQDCARKGRQWKQSRTHCVHGHLLSRDNIRVVKGAYRRICKACDTRRSLEYRRRLGAKPRIFKHRAYYGGETIQG